MTDNWRIKNKNTIFRESKISENEGLDEYEILSWKFKIFEYDVETDFLKYEISSRSSKLSEKDDFDSTEILAQNRKFS